MPTRTVSGSVALPRDGGVGDARRAVRQVAAVPVRRESGARCSFSAGQVLQLARKAELAACQPHIPWTPPPGGVAEEHRNSPDRIGDGRVGYERVRPREGDP